MDLPPTAPTSPGETSSSVVGLLVEQRTRWQRGERALVESYLERFPSLADDAEAVLDLIGNELLLRQEAGETPLLTDYLRRFPRWAAGVQAQFEVERALGAEKPSPSASIPGYEILGELGRGGMGIVYKARQLSLKRVVALKMILAGGHAGAEAMGRFRSEAEAVARLQHPNIVQIHDIGEADGLPFFTLEFVGGGTLASRVAGQPLQPAAAASLIEVLARAMHHAHERGVVHRDLKPANVLVQAAPGPNGAEPKTGDRGAPVSLSSLVKITDFGLAKQLESGAGPTRSGAIMGTPPYMAPEQASGATQQVGPLTDVYALGAILYELLTGRPPFQAPTPLEVLSQVLSREPVAPSRLQPRLPRDLETICLKALAKEPGRRYASALALAEDLRRFGAGEPILARRDPLWRKAWRQVRRYRLAYAAALLVATSLGVAALVFAYAREGRRLAAVHEQFEGALADVPWDEERLAQMEALADELDRLRPEKDASARGRLHGAFAQSLRRAIDQPNLQPEDVARAEAALTLLERRDADVARPLREHFHDRLRQWQPLVRLTATSPDSPALLGAVQVVGDALSPPPGRLPTAPLLLRQHDCSGDVRLEAQFGTGWEGVPWLGLALSSAPGSGYAFVLHSRRANPLRPADGPAALSLAAARAGDGELSLQILRNGMVLRQRGVDPAALAPGPLVLQATREGNRLSVRVNAQPALEVYDPFPLGRSVPGAFGLYWPDGVGLTRLEAARQTRPVAPSPLERGDELFERKQYAPARDEYRQAAAASTSAAVREEAAYKEALCHLELGARDEAEVLLARVAGQKDATAWPLLATAQLWVRLLREKRLPEADALLDRVHEDYPTTIFLTVVPDAVRGEIAATYASAARPRLLFVRPEHLSGFERAVVLADLFYDAHSSWPLWGRIGTRGNLVRAYHSLGQTQRALATAEKAYYEFEPHLRDQFASAAYAIVEQYYWLLMARGETKRALDDVTARLRDLPDTPGGTMYRNLLLVERVRLLAVLGDVREAERQADQFLAEYAAQKAAGQRYEPFAAAHLMLGFLREKRGDQTGAIAAWRDGSIRAWHRLHPQAGTNRLDSPMQLLHNHLVLSLSNDLTDQDVHEIQEGLLVSLGGGRAMVRLVEKDLSPSAASAMWRTPTGRGWALRIAFHQLSFAEYTRIPISLAAVEKIHQDAFPGGWSKDQEDVAWKTTESCIQAYADGKLSIIQLGQLRQGWQGSIGFLGWGGVRDTLEPSLRAPLAYLFSHRYLALKKPGEREALLRTALQSAPPGSRVHRLAQAELAARTK